MTRCTFKQGNYNCGSYAFNLYKEDIDQGSYCDRHYWQDQAQKARAAEREAWGVDWGRNGDTPCVSIIKRLPNDVIEVVAVEYAPYSYTTPPQRTEQLKACVYCGQLVAKENT